jgi:hypothetical protein
MVPEPENGFYAVPDDPTCDHEEVRHLAQDAGVSRYYRCPDCDTVLVRPGGPPPEGGTDDLGTIDPRMGDLLDDLEAYHGDGSSSLGSGEGSLAGRLLEACRRLVP